MSEQAPGSVARVELDGSEDPYHLSVRPGLSRDR